MRTPHPQEEAAIMHARQVLGTRDTDPALVVQSMRLHRDVLGIAVTVTSVYALLTAGVWKITPNPPATLAMAIMTGVAIVCAGYLAGTAIHLRWFRQHHQL